MSAEQAKQFLDQATQSLQSGQFQQALELVEQSIALRGDDPEAHILRGIALSQTGQPDTATEAFRKAISQAHNNPKAYYNLAVHLYSRGQKSEALEMAREAVRLDTKHAGARDLVTRIEMEAQPDSGVRAPRVEEPLAPSGMEPPPGTGVSSPPSPAASPTPGPGAPGPSAPYQSPPSQQQPPGGYHRPGYETGGIHSLQFIANMGSTWFVIGWIIVGLALTIDLVVVFRLVTVWDQVMRSAGDPAAAQRISQEMWGNDALALVLQLASYGATLGGLVWMILELVDRRGPWLWLLPYIVGCCCTCGLLQPVVQAIYMVVNKPK